MHIVAAVDLASTCPLPPGPHYEPFPPPPPHPQQDPGDALLIRTDLQRAREQFVMSTELHLTYLVVPANNHDLQPDWKRFVCVRV